MPRLCSFLSTSVTSGSGAKVTFSYLVVHAARCIEEKHAKYFCRDRDFQITSCANDTPTHSPRHFHENPRFIWRDQRVYGVSSLWHVITIEDTVIPSGGASRIASHVFENGQRNCPGMYLADASRDRRTPSGARHQALSTEAMILSKEVQPHPAETARGISEYVLMFDVPL